MIHSVRGLNPKSPSHQMKMEEEVFDNLKGLDISYSSEHSDEGGKRTNMKIRFGSNAISKKED